MILTTKRSDIALNSTESVAVSHVAETIAIASAALILQLLAE